MSTVQPTGSGQPDVEFRSQHPSQRRAELIAELQRRYPGIDENDLHDALEDIWIADIPIEELTVAEAVTRLEAYRREQAQKVIAALGPVSDVPPVRKTHDDLTWQGTKVIVTVETDAKFLEHQLAQVIDAVMTLHPDLPILIEILRPIAEPALDPMDAGSTDIPFWEDDDTGDADRDDINALEMDDDGEWIA